ncbi:MAG: hypothetical protein ACI835_002895 [Planctomycetota bacterium]|jgi:hypothetical protein
MKLIHLSLFSAVLFSACGTSTTDVVATQATTDSNPLDGFWSTDALGDAVEVGSLREMKSGTEVVVRGDVMNHTVVEGKAALMLYDHALDSCDEMGEDDHCPTPWDFCCVDQNDQTLGSVLVEFHADGKLADGSFDGFHGIEYLSDVVVSGTLELDESGNARLIAKRLRVE